MIFVSQKAVKINFSFLILGAEVQFSLLIYVSVKLKEIFVNVGVQAAYWGMLDEGRITPTTANLLMQSVDEALDLVSHKALCDWKGLSSYVNIPNYYKFFQTSIVPQKLVMYFTVERLESACYICAAFLRAHRIAQQQLHEFIGKNFIE